MLNFDELKKEYPLLTEEKFKNLLEGKKDILLKSTEEYNDYYSIYNGKLISTKFVEKKKRIINIYMEDDL